MQLTDFTEVVKIEKGWSHEQKYKVTNDQGESFLLRITPIEQYEYKKAEFENMKMISELGIPMCQPIEFGTCLCLYRYPIPSVIIQFDIIWCNR